jgi:hypothetical protein
MEVDDEELEEETSQNKSIGENPSPRNLKLLFEKNQTE